MSILDNDINISLGSVEDNCTSIRPWVNNRMNSYQLRQAFGLPMYDEYQFERYGVHHEISHYTLLSRACSKLAETFKDIPIDMLTGEMITSTLATSDIHVDAVIVYPCRPLTDGRRLERTQLIFELYRLNGRGQYKLFAWVEIIDHFANSLKWRHILKMWSGYKKNAGQISKKYRWGFPIYQAPRTHILQ